MSWRVRRRKERLVAELCKVGVARVGRGWKKMISWGSDTIMMV